MSDMQPLSIFEKKGLMLELLQELVGLPKHLYVTIPEDIEAGELWDSFETVCDQLYEYDIPLTAKARKDIQALGEILDMQEEASWISDNPEI